LAVLEEDPIRDISILTDEGGERAGPEEDRWYLEADRLANELLRKVLVGRRWVKSTASQ
jgi:hypothetical protein